MSNNTQKNTKTKDQNHDVESMIDRLQKRTALMMLLFVFLFGVPAVLAALAGNYIDDQLGLAPWGSIGFLFVSYIISWYIALKTYTYIMKTEQNDLPVTEEKHE